MTTPNLLEPFERVKLKALEILELNKNVRGRTVVFDLDDTFLNLGGYYQETFAIIHGQKYYGPIPPIVELAYRAKDMGYKLFIITARSPHKESYKYILENLEFLDKQIEHWRHGKFSTLFDNVFTSPVENVRVAMNNNFKFKFRRALETMNIETARLATPQSLWIAPDVYERNDFSPTNDKLKIILTMGDQMKDIEGFSNYAILLPRKEPGLNFAQLYRRFKDGHETQNRI
jgi:hypothetical protein